MCNHTESVLYTTPWYIHCPYKCLTLVHPGQTVDIRISSEERSLSQSSFCLWNSSVNTVPSQQMKFSASFHPLAWFSTWKSNSGTATPWEKATQHDPTVQAQSKPCCYYPGYQGSGCSPWGCKQYTLLFLRDYRNATGVTNPPHQQFITYPKLEI